MNTGNSNSAFVFYAITLGLAVLVRLAVPWIGEASVLVTMLTPAIATVIMLKLIAPEGGFRQAITSLGLTSAGLKGWPFAIGGPALIHALGLAILFAAGLKAAKAEFEFFHYDADHGFMNEQRDAHERAASELAWERMLGFWKKHLAA